MIRVKYSDNKVATYSCVAAARFLATSILLQSRGSITPVKVDEILYTSPGGIIVEKSMKIDLGMVNFT